MNYLFPKKIKERKRTLSIEETIISEQAAFLCQKYIEARFTRSNLCYYNPKSRKRDGEPTIACSEDVVNTLNEMGALLEKSYPKLYNNVLDQLNWRINLAILVCNMFNRVSEQIIASGVNWARIIAVYAFAGALAYDLTQTGDTRFIRCLSRWMGHFSARRLSPWIRQNGGWKGLVTHFKEEEQSVMGSLSRWLSGSQPRKEQPESETASSRGSGHEYSTGRRTKKLSSVLVQVSGNFKVNL